MTQEPGEKEKLMAIRHKLRPYQIEIGRAILDSVLERKAWSERG